MQFLPLSKASSEAILKRVKQPKQHYGLRDDKEFKMWVPKQEVSK
jgi:hypothetical protein